MKERGATIAHGDHTEYLITATQDERDKMSSKSMNIPASSINQFEGEPVGDFSSRFPFLRPKQVVVSDSSDHKEPVIIPDKDKKKLLFIILITLFVIETLMMNIETIMPTYIEKYHDTLTEIHSSTILV